MPDDGPTEILGRRWSPYVVTAREIERRLFGPCTLGEIRNRLQAEDIWGTGSRQFKNVAAYLLECHCWIPTGDTTDG